MKNKHLQNKKDRDLLRCIAKAVNAELEINQSSVRRALWLKFVFYMLVTLALYMGLFYAGNSMLFIINYVLFGFASLLLAFNFAHDFSHSTVFKSQKWNDFGFIAIYTLVGAHAEEWKTRHVNSHHFAPNVKDYDSDLKISGLIRVIPGSEHRWHHRFQHFYAPIAYTSYSLFWVFVKDFVIYFQSGNKVAGYHLSFWMQKLFYLTYLFCLPLLFSGQPWYLVLTGFLAMHLSQSVFLLFTFFMTHHVESTHYPETDENGMIRASWVMNQIRSSNDMHPFSYVANFILGGFNNHIAHHLFPHIHHVHYPRLNVILYRVLRENNIEPNQTSYWGGIASHLRLLRKMGRKPQGKILYKVAA